MPTPAEIEAAVTTIKNLVRAGSHYPITDLEATELARGALRAAEVVRASDNSIYRNNANGTGP